MYFRNVRHLLMDQLWHFQTRIIYLCKSTMSGLSHFNVLPRSHIFGSIWRLPFPLVKSNIVTHLLLRCTQTWQTNWNLVFLWVIWSNSWEGDMQLYCCNINLIRSKSEAILLQSVRGKRFCPMRRKTVSKCIYTLRKNSWSQWAHIIALILPPCYHTTLPKRYFLVKNEDFRQHRIHDSH